MAGLSTPLSADDRRVILAPATIAIRARIAPMLQIALPQIAAHRAQLPSYINQSLTDLLSAVERWNTDEREALADASIPDLTAIVVPGSGSR